MLNFSLIRQEGEWRREVDTTDTICGQERKGIEVVQNRGDWRIADSHKISKTWKLHQCI